MTILIQIKKAVRQLGEKILFDEADATILGGQKIGLVGRNGSGKSTLCRLILKEDDLDGGRIAYHPDLRLGYLRQHDPFQDGESVLGFLLRDSGKEDWRCGKVAGQFEIKGEMLEAPVRSLSGGWQTRVKLAALLLHDPNFLLLDEPTNFLDLRTQILLEHFLKDFRGAYLVVSHDRTFLNSTCDHTLFLSRGKLTAYPGTIDSFLEYQVEAREHDIRSNAAIVTKQKQLKRFIAKNKAGANTAAQARNKAKQLDRLNVKELGTDERKAVIRVPLVEERKGTALRCNDLSIGYPGNTVAKHIHVEVEYGSCVVIVGDNGQGKTTFLRTVTNSLDAIDGELKWGYGCDIGVYAQHVYTSLPPDLTVQEYLTHEAASDVTMQNILDISGSFLFHGNDVNKKVSVLSGGERARLCLAGLLLGKHSVLALDEPGNHLDVETVEALTEALKKYKGTVIFTSHDRHFMDKVATGVIEVRDGQVTNYPGPYRDYLYRVNSEIDEGLRAFGGSGAEKKETVTEADKAKRKEHARRVHQKRKELKNVEKQMKRTEELKKQLEEELLNVTDATKAQLLHIDHQACKKKLETIEDRWLTIKDAIGEL
jgi:ATP-binding cassette, subfamily F, member 3